MAAVGISLDSVAVSFLACIFGGFLHAKLEGLTLVGLQSILGTTENQEICLLLGVCFPGFSDSQETLLVVMSLSGKYK